MPEALDRLVSQARQARRENRLADARQYLMEAVTLCRTAGAELELAAALKGLGQIERDLGLGSALQHYEEAAAIHRAADDPLKLAHTVRHVADIHQDEGHLDLAEPLYQEALDLYRGHAQTPPLDLANAIRGMALLKRAVGEPEQAKLLWREARNLYEAVGVPEGVAECDRQLSSLGR